ncbi:MAG: helix-turn-helix domain-containing protein [Candidatus Thiodiazotropha sp.]
MLFDNSCPVQIYRSPTFTRFPCGNSRTIAQPKNCFVVVKSFNAKMPRLSENERNQALGMVRANMSIRQVARHFHCHSSTVSRLLNRVQQTGTTRDRPRPGAPRVTTQRQDNFIRAQHLRHRFLSATATARLIRGRHR